VDFRNAKTLTCTPKNKEEKLAKLVKSNRSHPRQRRQNLIGKKQAQE